MVGWGGVMMDGKISDYAQFSVDGGTTWHSVGDCTMAVVDAASAWDDLGAEMERILGCTQTFTVAITVNRHQWHLLERYIARQCRIARAKEWDKRAQP